MYTHARELQVGGQTVYELEPSRNSTWAQQVAHVAQPQGTYAHTHTYSIDHKIPNSSAHVSVSVSVSLVLLFSRRARMRPFDLANLM